MDVELEKLHVKKRIYGEESSQMTNFAKSRNPSRTHLDYYFFLQKGMQFWQVWGGINPQRSVDLASRKLKFMHTLPSSLLPNWVFQNLSHHHRLTRSWLICVSSKCVSILSKSDIFNRSNCIVVLLLLKVNPTVFLWENITTYTVQYDYNKNVSPLEIFFWRS